MESEKFLKEKHVFRFSSIFFLHNRGKKHQRAAIKCRFARS